MDKKIKNNLVRIEKGRVMRVIDEEGDYYDVVIAGGTPIETRLDIAQYAHVLSGFYEGRNDKREKLKVDRIILSPVEDGKLATVKGQGAVGHSGWLNRETESWEKHTLNQETLEVETREFFNAEMIAWSYREAENNFFNSDKKTADSSGTKVDNKG